MSQLLIKEPTGRLSWYCGVNVRSSGRLQLWMYPRGASLSRVDSRCLLPALLAFGYCLFWRSVTEPTTETLAASTWCALNAWFRTIYRWSEGSIPAEEHAFVHCWDSRNQLHAIQTRAYLTFNVEMTEPKRNDLRRMDETKSKKRSNGGRRAERRTGHNDCGVRLPARRVMRCLFQQCRLLLCTCKHLVALPPDEADWRTLSINQPILN